MEDGKKARISQTISPVFWGTWLLWRESSITETVFVMFNMFVGNDRMYTQGIIFPQIIFQFVSSYALYVLRDKIVTASLKMHILKLVNPESGFCSSSSSISRCRCLSFWRVTSAFLYINL